MERPPEVARAFIMDDDHTIIGVSPKSLIGKGLFLSSSLYISKSSKSQSSSAFVLPNLTQQSPSTAQMARPSNSVSTATTPSTQASQNLSRWTPLSIPSSTPLPPRSSTSPS